MRAAGTRAAANTERSKKRRSRGLRRHTVVESFLFFIFAIAEKKERCHVVDENGKMRAKNHYYIIRALLLFFHAMGANELITSETFGFSLL